MTDLKARYEIVPQGIAWLLVGFADVFEDGKIDEADAPMLREMFEDARLLYPISEAVGTDLLEIEKILSLGHERNPDRYVKERQRDLLDILERAVREFREKVERAEIKKAHASCELGEGRELMIG
jgi:hypothetical protein